MEDQDLTGTLRLISEYIHNISSIIEDDAIYGSENPECSPNFQIGITSKKLRLPDPIMISFLETPFVYYLRHKIPVETPSRTSVDWSEGLQWWGWSAFLVLATTKAQGKKEYFTESYSNSTITQEETNYKEACAFNEALLITCGKCDYQTVLPFLYDYTSKHLTKERKTQKIFKTDMVFYNSFIEPGFHTTTLPQVVATTTPTKENALIKARIDELFPHYEIDPKETPFESTLRILLTGITYSRIPESGTKLQKAIDLLYNTEDFLHLMRELRTRKTSVLFAPRGEAKTVYKRFDIIRRMAWDDRAIAMAGATLRVSIDNLGASIAYASKSSLAYLVLIEAPKGISDKRSSHEICISGLSNKDAGEDYKTCRVHTVALGGISARGLNTEEGRPSHIFNDDPLPNVIQEDAKVRALTASARQLENALTTDGSGTVSVISTLGTSTDYTGEKLAEGGAFFIRHFTKAFLYRVIYDNIGLVLTTKDVIIEKLSKIPSIFVAEVNNHLTSPDPLKRAASIHTFVTDKALLLKSDIDFPGDKILKTYKKADTLVLSEDALAAHLKVCNSVVFILAIDFSFQGTCSEAYSTIVLTQTDDKNLQLIRVDTKASTQSAELVRPQVLYAFHKAYLAAKGPTVAASAFVVGEYSGPQATVYRNLYDDMAVSLEGVQWYSYHPPKSSRDLTSVQRKAERYFKALGELHTAELSLQRLQAQPAYPEEVTKDNLDEVDSLSIGFNMVLRILDSKQGAGIKPLKATQTKFKKRNINGLFTRKSSGGFDPYSAHPGISLW